MPIYEYECKECNKTFEDLQDYGESPLKVCALCGSKNIKKMIGHASLIFKGSGFYITENRSESYKQGQAKTLKETTIKSD